MKKYILYAVFSLMAISCYTGFYIYIFNEPLELWKYLVIIPLLILIIPLTIFLIKSMTDVILGGNENL